MKKLLYIFCFIFSVGLQAQDCELPEMNSNSTGVNMSVLMHASFLNTITTEGSLPYIVAKTDNDLVVGAAYIAADSLDNQSQSIAIWGDDTVTEEIDGAIDGQRILLYLVDSLNYYSTSSLGVLNAVTGEVSDSINYTVNGIFVVQSGDANFECTGEISGCTDDGACNYNLEATLDDGSCEYIEVSLSYDVSTNTINSTVDSGNSITYTWFLNDALIGDANSTTITPLVNGVYTLIASTVVENPDINNLCSGEAVVEVTGLGIEEDEISFKLYPNPINDFLHVEWGSAKLNNIEIHSSMGVKILERRVEKNETGCSISTEGLPSGVHYISFKYLEKVETQTIKILH